MFNFLNQDEENFEREKSLTFFINGDSTRKLKAVVTFYNGLKFSDVINTIWRKLQLSRVNGLRFFNKDAVEIFEEDLAFIKSETILFVSEGEDFNTSSAFSDYTSMKIIG
jgi:hypothetical protein